MKIKHYIIVFILGILFTQISLKAQQTNLPDEFSKDQNDSTRKVYVYAGTGLFEWINLGIGFQINPEFSVSLKHAILGSLVTVVVMFFHLMLVE